MSYSTRRGSASSKPIDNSDDSQPKNRESDDE